MKNYLLTRMTRLKFIWLKHILLFSKLFLLTFLLILVYKGAFSLDPDFGWRLRTGYYILENGIPKTDLYTYTMPSFPWVDHAWPISLSFAAIHSFAGKVGLSVIFSAFALASLFVVASREKLITLSGEVVINVGKKYKKLIFLESFVFLLALSNLLPFSGIRAQVITWFMFSVLVLILLYRKLWRKWRYLLPVFFLIWGNLHGGFAAGLFALVLFTFLRFFRVKKIVFEDLAIVIFCILATLINPYGAGTWREVWSSLSDTQLRWRIAEWMPIILKFDIAIIAYNTFSFLLIFLNRTNYKLEEKGLYLFFLFQGITSARNIPLLVIVSLPYTLRAVENFYNGIQENPDLVGGELNADMSSSSGGDGRKPRLKRRGGCHKKIVKDKEAKRRFQKVYLFAWLSGLAILAMQVIFSLMGAYTLSEDVFYPKEAVSFIKSNMSRGNIMSEYGWGGYLIWKLPEKKVFIDGRMPSWRWEANIEGESNSAMQDYQDVLEGEVSYKEVFDKYQVDTVLWSPPKRETLFSNLDKKLNVFLERFGKERSDFDFIKQLEEDGWDKVHEDKNAVVYKEID